MEAASGKDELVYWGFRGERIDAAEDDGANALGARGFRTSDFLEEAVVAENHGTVCNADAHQALRSRPPLQGRDRRRVARGGARAAGTGTHASLRGRGAQSRRLKYGVPSSAGASRRSTRWIGSEPENSYCVFVTSPRTRILDRSRYSSTTTSAPADGTDVTGGSRGAAPAGETRCSPRASCDELLSAARFSPQHPIAFTPLHTAFDDEGLASSGFEKAGRPGEREPGRDELARLARDEEAGRGGDPHAQAAEAVEQPARRARPHPSAQPNDGVGRAVLARQQVGHPPGREGSHGKADSRAGLAQRIGLRMAASEEHARCRGRSARWLSPRACRRRGSGRSTCPTHSC